MASKFATLSANLGLTPEDLAEAIRGIFLTQAELINDAGLEDQIEFLFADHCKDSPELFKDFLETLARAKQSD